MRKLFAAAGIAAVLGAALAGITTSSASADRPPMTHNNAPVVLADNPGMTHNVIVANLSATV